MIKFYAKTSQGWNISSLITPFKFPAGEWHLKADGSEEEIALAAYVHGTDVSDYILLAEWADLIHSRNQKAVALIPYLPAARADRGHPFGAKIYADLINMAQLDEVIVFDPHSHAMPEMINNLHILDSARVIKNTLFGRSGLLGDYVGVIAPDEGATERTKRTAELLGLPMYQAKKHRDFDTGKLTGFSCEPVPESGRLIVVDDICDGGGTFLGLADATGLSRERLELWVSHGVFSGNAPMLLEKYGMVYTTDSLESAYRPDMNAKVVSLMGYLFSEITVKN
jgi:ribose-phosphate pyrophosphokinase